MKTYTVEYVEKYNCSEHTSTMTVAAPNAKEACKLCVKFNYERFGRHAFRPKAKEQKQE